MKAEFPVDHSTSLRADLQEWIFIHAARPTTTFHLSQLIFNALLSVAYGYTGNASTYLLGLVFSSFLKASTAGTAFLVEVNERD